MNKSYDLLQTASFIKGLTTLTGISQRKLQKYADENSLFNVLEHPDIIEPNKQQFDKINMLNEFLRAYKLLKIQEKENKITLDSSSKSGEYFISILDGIKDREKFMVAFLDTGNNVIETRTMSEGCIGETAVYPRNILKAALACDCKSLALAHNHPGGSLKPSSSDLEITKRLVAIFSPLQINVLDHIIVANSQYYSMAEQGMMYSSANEKVSYDAVVMEREHVVEEKLPNNRDYYESESTFNSCHESEEEDEWEI